MNPVIIKAALMGAKVLMSKSDVAKVMNKALDLAIATTAEDCPELSKKLKSVKPTLEANGKALVKMTDLGKAMIEAAKTKNPKKIKASEIKATALAVGKAARADEPIAKEVYALCEKYKKEISAHKKAEKAVKSLSAASKALMISCPPCYKGCDAIVKAMESIGQ